MLRVSILSRKAVLLHQKLRGKIFVQSKPSLENKLELIYTPGVAAVSKKIHHNQSQKFTLTSKSNNVAIITDGTRVLGLGNVGPYAALPVMEGKAVIYRHYGKISAFPICLNTTSKSEIVKIVTAIEPLFGAINLEDIEFPKVLEISNKLEKNLKIPVFHDDRHGTAVVALAALLNSLKITKKKIFEIKTVVAGAGSAGYGIASLFSYAGCKNLIVVDSAGAIYKGRTRHMNKYKQEIASFTNQKRLKGELSEVLKGADVFVGVSGRKDLLSVKDIRQMNEDPIVFALTNPDPEINPNIAKKAGAKIVATGSYAYQTKVNNAVVFPYLMRSILDFRIRKITPKLLYLSAVAIANTISKVSPSHIIPEIGNNDIQKNISAALRQFYNVAERV